MCGTLELRAAEAERRLAEMAAAREAAAAQSSLEAQKLARAREEASEHAECEEALRRQNARLAHQQLAAMQRVQTLSSSASWALSVTSRVAESPWTSPRRL